VRHTAFRASFAAILVLAAHLAAEARAQAQDAPSAHHLGAQLRAFVGPAFMYAVQEVGNSEPDVTTGFGAAFDFALGNMITDNLALNMDLALAHSPSADHGVVEDRVFSALHLGAGMTYWWMPANVYFAASLGVARSSVGNNPVRIGVEIPINESSDLGIGAHLALGKQFWLTRRVCLGATLSLLSSAANNPVGGRSTFRYGLITSVALTATLH
jgi:hypothetical protein